MRQGLFFPARRSAVAEYYRQHGATVADVANAIWRKSTISAYNGSCFEVAKLRENCIGVRDTKDAGAGPVLIFNQQEWDAFLVGVKRGEFDAL